MFVRFRTTKTRLQLSLIATARVGGKVQHEHIASLGSISMPFTAHDRLDFWQDLHQRLQRLGNRVDGESLGKILTAVHARISMVTTDEQRELKLKSAEEAERFSRSLHDMHEEQVTSHKGIVTKAQKAIATGEADMALLSQNAAAAKSIADRLRKGEDVAIKIERPMTQAEFLKAIGWTQADLRNSKVVQALYQLGAMEEAIQAASSERRERAIYRKVLRNKLREIRE
jgi:hypothetical protein